MKDPKTLLTTPILVLSLALSGVMLTGCGEEPTDEPFQSDVPQPEVSGKDSADNGDSDEVPSIDSNLQDE